ncbi:protein lifeguard 1-like [Artemia franciscana]|uniref:protein lifeguard 1-like n=1 Tax=Artemia franciscana TaxID=6661 RepID=UPI0032DAAAA7
MDTFSEEEVFEFTEKKIRNAFIRKVFTILTIQLAITAGLIAVFIYSPGVKQWTSQHPGLALGIMIGTIVCIIVLACCDNFRRKTPWNYIVLFIFTILEGMMLGLMASSFDADDVLLAIGIVAIITLALTLFSFQTKIDFTAMAGGLLCLGICLLMFGLFALIFQSKILQILYASLGALVFSFYLVFDLQIMMGGKHRYSISPEEYIFAALNLYLDIVNLFIYILRLIGLLSD